MDIRVILLLMCGVMEVKSMRYMVICPRYIRPSTDIDIHVRFLQPIDSEIVEAELLSRDNTSLATGNLVLGQGSKVGTVRLTSPKTLSYRSGPYRIEVSGTGSVEFQNTSRLEIQTTEPPRSVYIHTDKQFYKTGQKVRYRIFVLDEDLKLAETPFDVEIFDPKRHKIVEVKNVKDKFGLSEELQLSDDPPQGLWRIRVSFPDTDTVEESFFKVEEYNLPKFEVTVALPSEVDLNEPRLTGTVKATYTFGKPVKGKAVITAHFRQWRYSVWSSMGRPVLSPTAVQLELPFDGKEEFSFPMETLERLGVQDNSYVEVTAMVTEALTGRSQDGTTGVTLFRNKYSVKFLPRMSKHFRPGTPFTTMVKVSQRDGKSLRYEREKLRILTTYARMNSTKGVVTTGPPFSAAAPLIRLLAPEHSRAEIITEPDRYYPIQSNGLVQVTINVPDDVIEGTIEAVFKDVRDRQIISMFYSPTRTFLMLSLRNNKIQVGQMAEFEIRSNKVISNMITYHVVSKGRIVETHFIGAGGMAHSFYVEITNEMVPEATVVAYYVLPEGELIADGLTFEVDDLFKNKVAVGFSDNHVTPNSEVSLTLKADPGSIVNLLVVDKSVLLMGTENLITEQKVKNRLQRFLVNDYRWGGSRYEHWVAFPTSITKALWAENALQVLKLAGLSFMSDVPFRRIDSEYPALRPDNPFMFMSRSASLDSTESFSAGFGGKGAATQRVRKSFPETWIWTNVTVNSSGMVTLDEVVPDTITDWVATAFALNEKSGFGLAPVPANMTTFLSFFVSLDLPPSVVRGEIVSIQANVFNFYPHDMYVNVKLTVDNASFVGVSYDERGQKLETDDMKRCILVKSNDASPAYFNIKATALGMVPLRVSATSLRQRDSDVVEKQLLVKAEGKQEEKNHPVFVSLTPEDNTHSVTVPVTLPDNVVYDSAKVIVKVVGDIFGPSLDGLEALIQIPYGCGEQNMATFAPSIYAAQYLTATNRYTPELQAKIRESLVTGYQRELLYQRYDGSYSAFGNSDSSGSLWLTAFVLKSFAQAQSFVFIDPDVIGSSLAYIFKQQNLDGSFNKTGIVHHKAMQGGSAATNRSLAAYVLIALREVEKANILTNVNVTTNLTKSMELATSYLTRDFSNMTVDYELAISAYALSMVKHPSTIEILTKLNSSQNVVAEDGMLYWNDTVASYRVEVASYALMAYTELGLHDSALPIVRWLVRQRNPYGGFVSTQDTVVALQALSKVAERLFLNDVNLNITIHTENTTDVIHIHTANFDIVRFVELPGDIDAVSLNFTGIGIALVEVGTFYNVKSDEKIENFGLKINTTNTSKTKDKITVFNIKVCTNWTKAEPSGMVLLDVGFPSGFKPIMSNITRPGDVKRMELSGERLVFYFDQLTEEEKCIEAGVERFAIVEESSYATVTVYSYYDTDKSRTEFYLPEVLQHVEDCKPCGRDVCCGPAHTELPKNIRQRACAKPSKNNETRMRIPQEWMKRGFGGMQFRRRTLRMPFNRPWGSMMPVMQRRVRVSRRG